MDIRNVKKYSSPVYPDKESAIKNPAMLATLPERWKANASVCAALAATSAMLLTSCTALTGSKGGNPTGGAGPTNGDSPALAVPLFEHGIGRGGFGCVSVAPPAFLSEAEAYAVISEEAKKAGLVFKQDGLELKNVGIPKTSNGPEGDNLRGSKKGALTLDGYDENKKIAFEFVSTEDIDAWCVAPTNATVTSYDFIDTAKALGESLSKAGSGMPVAVFYDPGYKYDETVRKLLEEKGGDFEADQKALKELVKEDLRAQVRDFLAWLKAQDII